MSTRYERSTGQPVKTFTNEAWREREAEITGEEVPLVTVTVQRIVGTGPQRKGNRYEVKRNGAVVGEMELVSAGGGMRAWAFYDGYGQPRGNDTRNPWYGDMERAAWTLASTR